MSIKPGIYDMGINEYHNSPGISRSGILEIRKSPLHYWDVYINPDKEPKSSSKAMDLGSMVHTLVLEPLLFDQQFVVGQKFGNSKAGKLKKAEFEEANIGKTVVSQEELDKAKKITEAVFSHEKAGRILDGAIFEKSIYWMDEDTQLLCKARPDIWNQSIGIICDLKTTSDAAHSEFSRNVINRGYHIQAAMIIDGIYQTINTKIDDYRFIAAPTERPYKPYLYYLPEEMIERGRQEYKDALHLAKICLEKGRWDLEREMTILLDFSQYQYSANSFSQLREIYNARIN